MAKIACSLLMAGAISTMASAQEATTTSQVALAGTAATAPASNTEAAEQTPAEVAPAKRVTVTTGFDFATAYVFRGIPQEDHGTIAPAYFDVGVDLGKGMTLNAGNWSSLHSGPTGHSGHGNAWYEADYYGSLTFTAGKLHPGVLFTSYTSPNDAFGTVHELAAVLAYDDSDSRFPLAPKATVGFELHGQADGGDSKGTYLELGIGPELQIAPALALSIPVKVGLSLNDYYEGPTGSNRFGYFDTGFIAKVPFGGSWQARGGVDFLWFGDNMRLLNSDDRFEPVGIIGLSFTY